jgi:antitoxin ParD1/3/4
MNVSLTPELEELVNERVRSGLYSSASEVVSESLRLLKEHDEFRQSRLTELRAEIQIGLDAYNQADYAPLDINSLKSDLRKNVLSKK